MIKLLQTTLPFDHELKDILLSCELSARTVVMSAYLARSPAVNGPHSIQ